MNEYLRRLLNQGREAWGRLNRSQKATTIGIAAAIILTIVIVSVVGLRPRYDVLFSQLSAEDGGAIVSKLQEQDIPYRVRGNTIEVPENMVYDLRLRLASEGLPESGAVGYELLDKTSFTATEFTQKVNLKRALEGELSRTISQLEPVSRARVHIVAPEPSLFTEEEKETTASVLVKLKSGAQLGEGQVNGIVNLVQKSVEGLKTKNIVVVDTRGNILSTPSEEGISGKLTLNQVELKRAYENQMQDGIQKLIQAVMGPNKSTVKVNADMDFSQTTTDSKEFEGPPVTRSEQSEQEKYTGTGTMPAPGGAAGTVGNIPGFTFNAQGGQQTNDYKKNSTTINNEITERIKKQIKPPGEVKKLSVAVLVDSNKGLLPQQVNSVMAAVGAAAGIEPTRGDTLVVQSLPFDDTVEQEARLEEQAADRSELFNTLAKVAILIVLVGLAVYLARRMLEAGSREMGVLQLPAVAEAPLSFITTPQDEEETHKKQIYAHVERLAREKPDDIARLLERWLTAD